MTISAQKHRSSLRKELSAKNSSTSWALLTHLPLVTPTELPLLPLSLACWYHTIYAVWSFWRPDNDTSGRRWEKTGGTEMAGKQSFDMDIWCCLISSNGSSVTVGEVIWVALVVDCGVGKSMADLEADSSLLLPPPPLSSLPQTWTTLTCFLPAKSKQKADIPPSYIALGVVSSNMEVQGSWLGWHACRGSFICAVL